MSYDLCFASAGKKSLIIKYPDEHLFTGELRVLSYNNACLDR